MSSTELSGKRFVEHVQRGEQVHLFVRQTRKTKGKGAPFVYCGQVQLQEYQGEKPINVRFILEHPTPFY